MGTSVNQRSPSTPEWLPARRALGDKRVPIERQTQELWRAVAAERPEAIRNEFSHKVIIGALAITATTKNPIEAASRFDEVVYESGAASLVFDIARRALVRSVAQGGDARSFACELFSEATNYYSARDLPSVMSAKDRVENGSATVKLKEDLCDRTRSIAKITLDKNVALVDAATHGDRNSWVSLVDAVISRLGAAK